MRLEKKRGGGRRRGGGAAQPRTPLAFVGSRARHTNCYWSYGSELDSTTSSCSSVGLDVGWSVSTRDHSHVVWYNDAYASLYLNLCVYIVLDARRGRDLGVLRC